MSLAFAADRRDTVLFQTTQPRGSADARDLAFASLGVEEVCTWIVDTGSMASESCWQITCRDGVVRATLAQRPQSNLAAAMATIVQLNRLPGEQIVVRKLDPCRWGYAWRLDGRRVAVAEANYSQPRNVHTDADSASLRLICEAGLHAGRRQTAQAVEDRPAPSTIGRSTGKLGKLGRTATRPLSRTVSREPSGPSRPGSNQALQASGARAAPAMAVMRTATIPVVPASANSAHTSRQPSRRDGVVRTAKNRPQAVPSMLRFRMLGLAVLSVYAAVAAVVALSDGDSKDHQAQASSLQAPDGGATRQRADEQLPRGDYRQAQFQFDGLAAPRLFNRAAVFDPPGRTLAVAAELQDVRNGSALGHEVAATGGSRRPGSSAGDTQSMAWNLERLQHQTPPDSDTLMLAFGVCAAASVAALLVARRRRRDLHQSPDSPPPLSANRS